MKSKVRRILISVFSNGMIAIVLFVLVGFMFVSDAKTASVGEMEGVFYHGNKQNKAVSVMINVYWGEEWLDGMLDVLEKHNAKATFFVGGVWASKNTEMVEKIAEKGHEIGNHGFFHKDQSKLNYAQNQKEILNNHKLIEGMIGKNMNLFAPPSGAFCADTILSASHLGYKTILWSKDTIDWRDQDKNLILKRATTKLENGDFVLMHPTKATFECFDAILTSIEGQGFKIFSVSENISANII